MLTFKKSTTSVEADAVVKVFHGCMDYLTGCIKQSIGFID
jgi:hypothetical protein